MSDLDYSCRGRCEVYVEPRVYDKVEPGKIYPWSKSHLHLTSQDKNSPEWGQLLEAIDQARIKEQVTFNPAEILGYKGWLKIRRLPKSIKDLKSVKTLDLRGSSLLSLPPEIGDMESLEKLDLYRSYSLHWMPYEILKCKKLHDTAVSTRALYGNRNYRPPFPLLNHECYLLFAKSHYHQCSVCGSAFVGDDIKQVWLSVMVGTDVMPLLVNACSEFCLHRLPAAEEGYVSKAHTGGLEIVQPPIEF